MVTDISQDKDMIYVTLHDGSKIIADAEDRHIFEVHSWCMDHGSAYCTENRKTIRLASMIVGTDAKERVWHRNGDSLDYRKENLYAGNHDEFSGDVCTMTCFDGRKFVIDSSDYELVKKSIWHIDANGYVIGYRSDKRSPNGHKVAMKLHRLVMGVVDAPSVEIDHINHNTLDNRKFNLRIVTRSQNCCNTRRSKANTSGYKGVYWCRSANKWAAQIKFQGTRHYLGVFENINDAKEARDEAAKIYHSNYMCQ